MTAMSMHNCYFVFREVSVTKSSKFPAFPTFRNLAFYGFI